jgi:hypothetical protein
VYLGNNDQDARKYVSPAVQGAVWSTNNQNALEEFKTLVLLWDEKIDTKTYAERDHNGQFVQNIKLTRYRYELWSYDVQAGSLSFHTTLQDPEIPEDFSQKLFDTGQNPTAVQSDALEAWANSVTYASGNH